MKIEQEEALLLGTPTEFLDFSGPVQTVLRGLFGWGYGDYWFPIVRSLWGAIVAVGIIPVILLSLRIAGFQINQTNSSTYEI